MRKSRLLIILVLLGVILGACGAKDEREKIKIGLLRIDDSVPFYVAEEEGLFQKADLDVELVSFSSSSDQAVAIEAGEIDIVMNDIIVQALLKKNGTQTKILETAYGATPSEGRFVVVAAPNSGINEPKDLLGKNVGISSNTMMDYLFERFEEVYNLDKKQITTVNMPNLSLRLEAVLSGKDLDAAILPDPLAAYALAQGCVAVIDDTALGVNLSQSVVLGCENFIAQNGEDVQQILAAYDEAKELLNDNPAKYRQLALEVANVPAEISESYPAPHYTIAALPSAEYVEDIMSWLMERELISEQYTYEDLVWDGQKK